MKTFNSNSYKAAGTRPIKYSNWKPDSFGNNIVHEYNGFNEDSQICQATPPGRIKKFMKKIENLE